MSDETQGKLNFAEANQQELENKINKNKITPESMRLSYYALLAAAMMYKEMFWCDDIEITNNAPTPDALAVRTKFNSKVKNKTIRNQHEEDKAIYKKKTEYMNKRMYEEVQVILNKMDPKAKGSFERTVEYLTAATEELLYARDMNEALGILKSYNAGEFDFLFEKTRKEAAEKFINQQSQTNETPIDKTSQTAPSVQS